MELYLPHLPINKRRTAGIEWTEDMLTTLKNIFPCKYNQDIASELGVSVRTVIRKARELGLEKEPNFLEIRRKEISAKAKKRLVAQFPKQNLIQRLSLPSKY